MKSKQPYMKAVLTGSHSNARNLNGEKELTGTWKVIDKKTEREIIDCRTYMGRSSSASAVYCALWVHSGDTYTTGRGVASGYGYHKSSAAIASAISSAGIELYGSAYGHPVNGDTPAQTRKLLKQRAHIGGCGDSSIDCALLAIAYAIGSRDVILVKG